MGKKQFQGKGMGEEFETVRTENQIVYIKQFYILKNKLECYFT